MWVSESLKQLFKRREEELLNKILELNFPFVSIGIFGSYARNEYKLTSDLDMCIIVRDLPSRVIKGWLYEEADILNADLIFVTEDYFHNDSSKFAINLRRDYKEVYKGVE